MKVVYTVEQRRVAVAAYRRLSSYAKTLRKLGYPSRHVLRDWVHGTNPGQKRVVTLRPPRHNSWKFKAAAVERVLAGEDVRTVGVELHMTTHVLLYKWVQIWHEHGNRGLMSKREKAKADGFPTQAVSSARSPMTRLS